MFILIACVGAFSCHESQAVQGERQLPAGQNVNLCAHWKHNLRHVEADDPTVSGTDFLQIFQNMWSSFHWQPQFVLWFIFPFSVNQSARLQGVVCRLHDRTTALWERPEGLSAAGHRNNRCFDAHSALSKVVSFEIYPRLHLKHYHVLGQLRFWKENNNEIIRTISS